MHVRIIRRISAGVLAGLLASVLGCGGSGDSTSPTQAPTITITPSGGSTLTAGVSLQLTASLTDERGKAVPNATFTWRSSNTAVATVSGTGMVSAAGVGTATITATTSSAASASGTWVATVTAGAPSKLVVTVQPAGGAIGRPLATQPVVEIRDAFDNVVTTVTAAVTVAPLSGPTLGGTTSITAVAGVARFTDLVMTGASGGRTLVFSSGTLPSTVSQTFTVAAGPPVAVGFVTPLPVFRSGVPATIAAKLLDAAGNDASASGRAVTIALGGAGTLTNATARTDSTGRATFTGLTLTGVAGARSLTLNADSIATPASASVALIGGRPFRLAIERDVPNNGVYGLPLSPPPSVRVLDSIGNTAPEGGVAITASVVGVPNAVTNGVANTDATGLATFNTLTISGTVSASRQLQFSAAGLPSITSRAAGFSPPDTNPIPSSLWASAAGTDTTQKVVLLSSPTGSASLAYIARDIGRQLMPTAGVRWFARDPSRVRVDSLTGAITGLQAGRTFVIAQARRNDLVADSVLVFVPRNSTGPILRTQLTSYRVGTDTVSIVVIAESRDGRPFTAIDFEVSWPGSFSAPFSPFNVTGFQTLQPSVTYSVPESRQNVRVTWASTTPASGAVPLIRLICVVNQRGIGNQVLLTLNQLLTGDLTDVTSLASVFNPILIFQ